MFDLLAASAHLCHLFTSEAEQMSLAMAFLNDGLAKGESCLFVAGRQKVDDWYAGLQARGVDVQRAREQHAIQGMSGAEYRQPEGFNSIVKARGMLEVIFSRLDRFPGVRMIGDVAWEYDPPLPTDQLCHWEATADLAYADLNVQTICQYDLSSDSPSVLWAALRTHSLVILNGRVCENPFFEAARILENEPLLNRSFADSELVERVVTHLAAVPSAQAGPST